MKKHFFILLALSTLVSSTTQCSEWNQPQKKGNQPKKTELSDDQKIFIGFIVVCAAGYGLYHLYLYTKDTPKPTTPTPTPSAIPVDTKSLPVIPTPTPPAPQTDIAKTVTPTPTQDSSVQQNQPLYINNPSSATPLQLDEKITEEIRKKGEELREKLEAKKSDRPILNQTQNDDTVTKNETPGPMLNQQEQKVKVPGLPEQAKVIIAVMDQVAHEKQEEKCSGNQCSLEKSPDCGFCDAFNKNFDRLLKEIREHDSSSNL